MGTKFKIRNKNKNKKTYPSMPEVFLKHCKATVKLEDQMTSEKWQTQQKQKPEEQNLDKRAVEMLQEIVNQFNESLDFWHQNYGCDANFIWNYRDNQKKLSINSVVSMDIDSIERVLYRREPQVSKEAEQIMKDAKDATVKPQAGGLGQEDPDKV